MKPPTAESLKLDRRLDVSALGTLFGLTVRQHLRGQRLWLFGALFTLPVLIAVLLRATGEATRLELETSLLLGLLPYALVPLTALVYASGMIRDEIEDQTLTYLLVRPLPRSAIYLTKFLATWLVTAGLAGVFGALTCAAVYWGAPNFLGDVVPGRVAQVAGMFALTVWAYCGLFGLMSLFTNRALVAGVAFIFIVEWILGTLEFGVRRLTVAYYFRVLAVEWLDVPAREMSLVLADLPSAGECVFILLLIGAAAAYLGSRAFRREFTVKTPEGA